MGNGRKTDLCVCDSELCDAAKMYYTIFSLVHLFIRYFLFYFDKFLEALDNCDVMPSLRTGFIVIIIFRLPWCQ
jgi:hypothetical protein